MKSKWIEKWPIEVVKSVRKGESFTAKKSISILTTHTTLAFIVLTTAECWNEYKGDAKYFTLTNLRNYLENLEKRFFIYSLTDKKYKKYFLPIKEEGEECFKTHSCLTFALKEPCFNFDKEYKPIVDKVEDTEIEAAVRGLENGKKIIMTDRLQWQHTKGEDFEYACYFHRYRRRLGFFIMPKEYEVEKNET